MGASSDGARTPYDFLDGDAKDLGLCMVQAMEEAEVPQELRKPLEEASRKTADWMRNKAG